MINNIDDIHILDSPYGGYYFYYYKECCVYTAEEWIIMNKPCLSIKDVLSVGQRVIVDEGRLKQIVRSKL